LSHFVPGNEKIAEARRMQEEGKGYREIVAALKVSIGTVSGWLKTK
jgi:DNA invertase Pin-like site-specific DNA recombinase